MADTNKVIELELDVDGVYKAKKELKKDIPINKKVDRIIVNNSNKVVQFLQGVDIGLDLLTTISKKIKKL